MTFIRSLAFLSVLSGTAITALGAQSVTPKMIYGEDNRVDLYTVKDAAIRSAADSTVLLVHVTDFDKGSGYKLKTKNFGQEMQLCSQERFADQPTVGFCSGFLVGPDLMVTAGHCIDDSTCEDTRFVFGFHMQSETKPTTNVANDDVYACKRVVQRQMGAINPGDPELDFAVVQLDRPVANHSPLKIRRQGRLGVGTDLTVIGHPMALPTKIAAGASVRDTNTPGYFVANLDTYGGNSGSAVFNGKTLEVEGILVRGDTDFVFDSQRGCWVSNVCASNDGCRGEDSTDITFLQSLIPGGNER
ncbi:MAG: trypsin-like peptidase domain-containing protein [Bdellovibrionales bacterium]|nr:trypsin-like peptidase domain-containing protein [Bdellovibrionales bacterium]